MKTHLIKIILIITIVYSCDKIDVEIDQFINDSNHPALQNKLKTKSEILQGNNARVDYYYNASGFLTKEETYTGNKLDLTHIYERNKNGNKTKEYSYTTQAKPSKISTYYSYEYSEGKLVKESHVRNGELLWYIDHKYENDQLIESRKYENGQLANTKKAEYDSLGRILKASSHNSVGELLGATRYEYTKDTIFIFSSGADGIESTAVYQEIYNASGQIKEEAYQYNQSAERRVTNRFFYNELQLLIESHHFDAGFPESMGPLSIYEYEYF